MVQSPDSASFSNMLLEAILSGHPDVIGTPEKIARDLLHFTRHSPIISPDSRKLSTNEEEAVQKIISLVNEFSGVNFWDYKMNTVLRRIDKRSKINYKNNVKEYFQF